MPSRRSVLAASSLAIGGALAGCGAVRDPPGTSATVRDGAFDVPDAESAPVVARAGGQRDEVDCPQGSVYPSSRVHEVRRDGGPDALVLVTEYRVVTGASGCDSGWGHAGITVRHDWGAGDLPADGAVIDHASNVVPVGDDGTQEATLEQLHDETEAHWAVHRTPPSESTATYRFASWFTDPGSPERGDPLVQPRGEVRLREGTLGGSGTVGSSESLVYGETPG